MHIEINGDAEKVIEAGLVSGEFGSAEQAVAAMAKVWASRKETAFVPIPTFPATTDLSSLAANRVLRLFDPD